MQTEEHYHKLFERLSAIQKGHFILTSGNHSDTYVQCARILERPDVTARLCKKLIIPWKNNKIDIVVGPAVGGIIISYELARMLSRRNSGWQRKGIGLRQKAKAMYLERVEPTGLTLRRGFSISAGDRAIVAEDVITTGGSVKEVVDIVEQYGGKVVGIISLVDRRPEKNKNLFGIRFNSLVKVNPPIYQPDKCPLCAKGIAAEKPGSRGIKL
ncbi:MAG: orotate phosphoribosyltransferase [Planctomycetota bacterium]|nr:orotate phosphoribosyltransferase [Planctomycetota bacterium]MDI6788682.1 orotate phosphoribosyltransferase [Planctomycetota bacterium]